MKLFPDRSRNACLLHTALFLPVISLSSSALAATGGSITGTVRDSSGAILLNARLQLTNTAQKTSFKAITDKQGFYSFPDLPVGHYDLTVTAPGFSTRRQVDISVDADAALRLDTKLNVGSESENVTVSGDTGIAVDTVATQLGEVVSGDQMRSLPLNGRSYTDLLAIQPGVVPQSTLLPSSVIMAGVTGSINPSGDLNAGNLSINGQRESSNGFLVNGIDVQEHMNGGTSVIPDLDSIDEFRVLTDNFDPEYGNYNGGIVTVVTRSGASSYHGSAFEFLRNTALDARGYFDPQRSAFRQNQFGGTLGAPLLKDLFFFADYQGTRTTQGISTGNISVPSDVQRTGNFIDPSTRQSLLTGKVGGPYFASLLTHALGQPVSAGEPYSSVFPAGIIPQRVWSAPAKALLPYIPAANISDNQFSTSAFAQTVRDDKASGRVDLNGRFGQISGYYFIDDYQLDNPYPGSQAGASIPGFDALTIGRAQLFSIGDTKAIGSTAVNELHLGYLRNANIIGQPKGGLGVSLASQGFTTGAGTPGIDVQAPQFEGVENITFPSFVVGVPVTNETQINNTWYLSDSLSKTIGNHTLKLGAQFHDDQVNEHPNATFNGTFNISGTETGDAYADFLLGVASNFTQSSGQPFYLRNRYAGLYLQDSWHVRDDLTINAGLRWDLIRPWSERYNQLQTYIPGAHSVLYPGAPEGFVVAGDPGVPDTIAPTSYKNFAPRIGAAYSPHFTSSLLKAIFGENGRSSIRASYGLFYTAFPGLAAGIMYAVPPFGYNYLSPAPPLLTMPFINAGDGTNNGQRFPFAFPPHNVSRTNPDTSVNWANFIPISADPFFYHKNQVPYINSYMVSIQRQLNHDTLLTFSYVGNQGHRQLALVSVNPGNPALCLSLPGCGPLAEENTYTNAAGDTVQGTRVGQGPNYGENTADKSIANSNYNSLETTLNYRHSGSQVLLSYTYAKSIDQGSNLGEQLNPIDPRQSRAISAFDLRHNFSATYSLNLPLADLTGYRNRFTFGWRLSGTTRFATGFPVTLYDTSDNSLLGTLGNGANNNLLDTPQVSAGALRINTNGRDGRSAFDTSLFHEEQLGQLGNAKRRFFYGPGIENFDMTLEKSTRLGGEKSLLLRLEGFNVFNHAQFDGPASVDGTLEDPNFGKIVSAADPRLVQVVAKFLF